MKKIIVIFFLITTQYIFAQNPSYELILKNDNQTSATEYEFDITLRPVSPTTSFELASLQPIMTFNTGISNGALSFTIISGTSDLLASQQPTNASISGSELRVAAKTPPGAGNGTIVNSELRVARFRITSSTPFNVQNANINWKNSGTPATVILAYVGGINTNITNPASHINQLANPPLPVELSSFTGKLVDGNEVNLNWVTKTEVSNFGFNIERRINEGEWNNIGFVEGHGNSNSPKQYSYTDNDIFAGGSKFQYRLKQVDTDGKFEYSDVVEVDVLPTKFELSQNYPNPFNPSTTIQFSLPKATQLKINVYNTLGERVETIAQGNYEAGYHKVNFNASSLPSGAYIYRIESSEFVQVRKMILIK
jgi:hypothetical protein